MTFPDTTFVPGTTITSNWLNAVNDYCNESNPAEHSSANVEYDPPFTGSVATTVQDKLAQTISLEDFGLTAENTPFGNTGVRLVVGENRDAHCAWGSIVEIENSTKWVLIYRKGTQHGIEDGAEVRAADSYDFGLSWENDRLVQTDATTDSRPDKLAVMANGRIGFFCNRDSAGSTNKYPLFIYSDDAGVTWTKTEVPTSSLSYTFASVGGIIAFPASQGGNDTTGFITFGYINAGGLDAFTTVNNGTSWSTVSNVTGSTVVSENIVIRLGATDRWLAYVRSGGDVLVYKITNLLSWGTSQSAGIESLSTPPGGFYDEPTNKIYYVGTARAGREIGNYKNNFVYVNEDADTLWSNGGVFTSEYKSLITAPNWATGYFYTFESKLGIGATFTAGENQANGKPPSSVWMVGNFNINGADVGMFVNKYTRNLYDVNLMSMQALDNLTTTYPLTIYNASKTSFAKFSTYGEYHEMGGAPTYTIRSDSDVLFDVYDSIFGLPAKISGIDSALHIGVQGSTYYGAAFESGSSSTRKHCVFYNTNGEVGSISTSGTATAFNTSSDETRKNFTGKYDPLTAISVIKADPVRTFNWKEQYGNGYGIGWGAQTSYKISQDLASPGGWFKDDKPCEEGTEGAIYIPWGIDQSKRTPYLWAAVSHLVDKLEEAEKRIAALEAKCG